MTLETLSSTPDSDPREQNFLREQKERLARLLKASKEQPMPITYFLKRIKHELLLLIQDP